jgi:hypothetical protein
MKIEPIGYVDAGGTQVAVYHAGIVYDLQAENARLKEELITSARLRENPLTELSNQLTRIDDQSEELAAIKGQEKCLNDDKWNCKYCHKTGDCKALHDPTNYGTPTGPVKEQGEPVALKCDHCGCTEFSDYYVGTIPAALVCVKCNVLYPRKTFAVPDGLAKDAERYRKLRRWMGSNVPEGWQEVEKLAAISCYMGDDEFDASLDGMLICNVGLCHVAAPAVQGTTTKEK